MYKLYVLRLMNDNNIMYGAKSIVEVNYRLHLKKTFCSFLTIYFF